MIENELNKFMCLDEELMSVNIKYNNWDVWPIVRYSVSEAILSEKGLAVIDHKKINNRNNNKSFIIIIRKITDLLKSIFSLRNVFGTSDILVINTTDKVLPGPESGETLVTWTFKKALSENYKVTFIDTMSAYKGVNKNFINISELLRLFRYFSKYFINKSKLINLIKPIIKKIKKNYQYDIGWSLNQIYISFINQIILAKLIEIIINFKKPKIIIYDDNGTLRAVNKLAYQKNIKTIDYQHALLSEHSIIYRHNVNCPYVSYRPFYYMSWGSFNIEKYNSFYKCLPVGNLYFDEMVLQNKYIKKEKETLTIISDGEHTRKDLSNLALSLADKFPNSKIYYKLRFEEYRNWKSLYDKDLSQSKNIVMIDSNENPLYYYLKKSSYIIGTNSTALIESIPLSNVIVFKRGWYFEMNPSIQNNLLLSANNVDEILKMISSKISPNNLDTEIIFKKNSLENIRYEIKKLMT